MNLLNHLSTLCDKSTKTLIKRSEKKTLRRNTSWTYFTIFLLLPSSCVFEEKLEAADQVRLLLQNPLMYSNPADRCAPPICTALLDWISSATDTIDFAIYGSRDQTQLLDALLSAKNRGIKIRGYVDRDYENVNYYASTKEWEQQLGVITNDHSRETGPEPYGGPKPKCDRPPGFDGPLQCLAYDLDSHWLLAEHASREDFTDPTVGGTNEIMHHKFFVIDKERVWTGSANISDSGTGGYSANVAVAIESGRLASLYEQEFTYMINRGSKESKPRSRIEAIRVGDLELETWFSPQDSTMRFAVQPLIARAERTIDVSIFFLTNKYTTANLLDAHMRGVKVRVIVDATSAKNGYTKHELLREARIPVKVENWGGKMHAKAAVVDGEYLILGSMNWTAAGETTNDENTLILHSRRLAGQYRDWFDELWESIPDRWLANGARPDPESLDSGTACMDGVDNDFDQLIDSEDPGCGANPPPLPDLPPHRLLVKSLYDHNPPRTHRKFWPTKVKEPPDVRWTSFAR